MKHLILFLIFFSFSRSTASSSISFAPSSLDAQFLSFPKPEEDRPFSMLPVDVDPRLQQLCEGTEHPIKCLTTVISFLDDKAVVDPVSIVKEEVDAFYGKVKEALHKALKRLSNRSTSRFVTNRLKSCIDDYKTLLKNKQKIIDAISMGDQTLPVVINPKLQRICDQTDNPVECLITTVPFLHEKAAINPVSILKIKVEAVDIKTKEALDKASKLLLYSSNSKPTTFCFNICINNYKSILESKHRILDAILLGDEKQLRVELSSNVDKIYHCEDAFEEANIKSPITE
ncbi:hypothetical protein Goari_026537, partial [Gossypium aridum]|nr:hypothetical protein [Gossypium aridum]